MKLPILTYGHPILEQVAQTIPESKNCKPLIDNMLETMRNADGVGLAAPQIGQSLRLFVIEPEPFSELTDQDCVFINPEIIQQEGRPETAKEGCLSLPGLEVEVTRQPKIMVEYRDANFTLKTKRLKGFLARVFQHELDHLEGILHIHRLDHTARRALREDLDKLKAGRFTLPGYPMKLADGTLLGAEK